ncbi:MAG: hypothetical protein HY741_21405 [Chloroflexi bacterium]|nr:hypothetical protein [Chloroflexota bacterium]
MSISLQKLSHLIRDMQELENELFKYERKYRLRSADFYRLVHQGKLEQSRDFIIWLGMYKALLAREREYKRLFKSELAPIVTALNREASHASAT